jgi:tRNA(Ile)-lysidine synthase TilS/MesJ
VCNHCRRYRGDEHLEKQKARLRRKFDEILTQVRGRGEYDCLMSWSGGKDSTYTLSVLKGRFGLRVLAFTFDNGFVSPRAFENMRVVAENLEVDHIIVKPRFDLMRQVFVGSAQRRDLYAQKALERASNVCTSCMGFAKGIALRLALERDIPLLAYGWSPGQAPITSAIFRGNPQMMNAMLQATMEPMCSLVGEAIIPYFPTPAQLAEGSHFPYNVSPLAFLDYDEAAEVEHIRKLGWQRPDDTDPNSTNCLLNAFAIQSHFEQMDYHPYALELANLVREGYLDREEAIVRLEEPPNQKVLATVQAKLGL